MCGSIIPLRNLHLKEFFFLQWNSSNYLPFWLYCISFLHAWWISWQFLATKSNHQARKKYNVAKWQIFWTIYIVKRKTCIPEDSSKEYCCHLYPIKALVKTFLLNTVSHLGFFGRKLGLQGTSVVSPRILPHPERQCRWCCDCGDDTVIQYRDTVTVFWLRRPRLAPLPQFGRGGSTDRAFFGKLSLGPCSDISSLG